MSEERERRSFKVGQLLIRAGVLLVLVVLFSTNRPGAEAKPTITSTNATSQLPTDIPASPTPEPIVPTPTPTGVSRAEPTATRPFPSPTATRTPQQISFTVELWQDKPRWGIGVASGSISRYNVKPLRLGWYLDWRAQLNPPRPGDIEYTPMVRLVDDVLQPDAETIAAIAQANPGSLWLIGNEPDVIWQDNVKPEAYARLYHEAYTVIKAADPTAQVAIGGVAQPTPLRLRYLDEILAAYREQFSTEMPVDVWNVHNFILREERGSWGVDIPPGMSDDYGVLHEIDDNDNLEIFQQQIVDFRRWMAERGYQDRPLIVSEYGILMPEDYGFPPERVVAFLRGTFDFFLTATDPALGYPGDDYRLVQRWCWYSLDASEHLYPTGSLFDPRTRKMTAVGEGWVEYVEGRAFSRERSN